MAELGTIMVTGGAGFIGSAVIRHLIRETGLTVVNVDKCTYAANLESLAEMQNDPRLHLERIDICDGPALRRVFAQYRPMAVMHLAAESHVDRSIHGPAAFIETNIVGTATLLEVVRAYWSELSPAAQRRFRFHHISTDEVYGDLGQDEPAFTEARAYAPSSPYSASKAASDHLVRAWHRTYGLPVVITNCSNNYGPHQFPEKLIPLMILNAVDGKALPVYGDGGQIRDWLYVEDHAKALYRVLEAGGVGRTYNIGGRCERTNLDVVHQICALLDRLAPSPEGPYERLVTFVTDRPGHDRRYAIDDTLIARELNWHPVETFESGLEKTVRWYLGNPGWVEHVRTGAYREWIDANYGKRETAS